MFVNVILMLLWRSVSFGSETLKLIIWMGCWVFLWKRGPQKSHRERVRIGFDWNELWSNDDVSKHTIYSDADAAVQENLTTKQIVPYELLTHRHSVVVCPPAHMKRCQTAKERVHHQLRPRKNYRVDSNYRENRFYGWRKLRRWKRLVEKKSSWKVSFVGIFGESSFSFSLDSSSHCLNPNEKRSICK